MADQVPDASDDPDAFRTALVGFMRTHDAEFELPAQLCTSLDRMPVEDAAVTWPEDESPYVAVARLALPAQDAYSPARRACFDTCWPSARRVAWRRTSRSAPSCAPGWPPIRRCRPTGTSAIASGGPSQPPLATFRTDPSAV